MLRAHERRSNPQPLRNPPTPARADAGLSDDAQLRRARKLNVFPAWLEGPDPRKEIWL